MLLDDGKLQERQRVLAVQQQEQLALAARLDIVIADAMEAKGKAPKTAQSLEGALQTIGQIAELRMPEKPPTAPESAEGRQPRMSRRPHRAPA